VPRGSKQDRGRLVETEAKTEAGGVERPRPRQRKFCLEARQCTGWLWIKSMLLAQLVTHNFPVICGTVQMQLSFFSNSEGAEHTALQRLWVLLMW